LARFTGAAVVMGVAGSGKSTVGSALAARLVVPFIEGDTLHGPANVAKMAAGIPLTDEDRLPWLARVGAAMRGARGCVASCSALKRGYREAIVAAAGRPVAFILLHGDRSLLEARLAARIGHFMPPSLLDSQLATLEPLGPDEWGTTLDLSLPVDALIARAAAYLLPGTDG
jgi:carbohydrate kinase (thermoresistant glucokinase family)